VTDDGAQYFELLLPDTFRTGTPYEKYGIGYDGNDSILVKTKTIVEKLNIGKLVRRYYYLSINDLNIWNQKRYANLICLDNNKRYGYTTEQNALTRELPASKFYFRFTYQPSDKPGRPEYYALLDRVDVSDFDYLTTKFGLEITKQLNTSHGNAGDGYGVLQAAVNENTLFVEAQPKALGANRISTYAISRIDEPLYRRLNDPDLEGGEPGDGPKVVKFFEQDHPNEYLVEDRMGPASYIPGYQKKINYLGTESEETKDRYLKDEPLIYSHLKTHNYAFYVDTAYINRGTGWIKPQYLIAVGPEILPAASGCNRCNDPIVPVGQATYARYLINATDSARPAGTVFNSPNLQVKSPNGSDYLYSNWERLAFVPAIHLADTLYILKGLTADIGTPSIDNKYIQVIDNVRTLDFDQLKRDVATGLVVEKRLDNNLHKDVVFQFRYVVRQRTNDGKIIPDYKEKSHFLIESETTHRDVVNGRMIAPMIGGWVKINNEVPVISRGAYGDDILDAQEFNVKVTEDAPLASETVDASAVTVLSGTGSVTILNASGKSVVISNILGQIVTNTVLTSDNATLSLPKGIVVVAVEGESAVKAIVK
jgi:hypothetical protein